MGIGKIHDSAEGRTLQLPRGIAFSSATTELKTAAVIDA
jgi:hypothetical protein